MIFKAIILCCIFFYFSFNSSASPSKHISLDKSITLNLSSRSYENREYFFELIKLALEQDGYQVIINDLGISNTLRQKKNLNNDKLSLIWRLKTPLRDKNFTRVNIGLSKGLIAQRVLLIRKNDQHIFSNIKNKQDLNNNNLVAAFGESWFDIEIWRRNNLPYFEFLGDRQKIYTMLASGKRNIDYFSRGINEVLSESKRNPNLNIEQNLLFCYQNDTYFYVKKDNHQLAEVLEKALTKAVKSGLLDRLIEKFWGNLKQELQLDTRTKITLDMPK